MVVAVIGAAGCASTGSQHAAGPGQSVLADDIGNRLSGRISIVVAAQNDEPAHPFSASFELQGGAALGRLDLNAPTGSTLASAHWSPSDVVLLQSDGSERHYAGLDDLAQSALGERIPLAALFDWLHGHAWSGAPFAVDPAAPATRFIQLGWSVDLGRYADALVSARRLTVPEVTVRVKLDAP